MTPEQLKYVRDWARNGNEPMNFADVPPEIDGLFDFDSGAFVALNSHGLTIAKLADALELTGAACEALYTLLCADPSVPLLVKARMSGMMADVAMAHEGLL